MIVRAVREKLKPFLFGTRAGQLGVEALLEKLDREAAGEHAADTLRITKVLWTSAQLAAEVAAASRAKALGQKAGQKRSNKNKRAAKAAAAANEAAAVLAAEQAVEKMTIAATVASSSSSSGAAAPSTASDADSGDESKEPSASAAAAAVPAAAPDQAGGLFLEFSHPELDLLGTTLTELGATRLGEGGGWRLRCPSDPADEAAVSQRLREAYASAVLHRPFAVSLSKVTEKVQGRIRAIDHIPLSDLERRRWIDDAAAFLQWLLHQIVTKRRWAPKEVMNQYSQLWTFFREEQAEQADHAQQATTKQQ